MAEVRKGFSWASLIALILALIACFGVGWGFKPSTTNKVSAGATQVVYNKEPAIPLGGCALWKLNLRASWQTEPTMKDKK